MHSHRLEPYPPPLLNRTSLTPPPQPLRSSSKALVGITASDAGYRLRRIYETELLGFEQRCFDRVVGDRLLDIGDREARDFNPKALGC